MIGPPVAKDIPNYSVIFRERGIVALEASDIPAISAHQLLIRTRTTLISPGTERAWFLGMDNTSQQFPQRAGYSNIGEVIEVGAAVDGWSVGDRVACKAHHATYAAVDADKCIAVPVTLSDEEAVFFQLASIAMQAVRKAHVELGESVAVIGAGLIGLLALQLARLSGALPALSVDLDEGRLAFAQKVGADATVKADDALIEKAEAQCDGDRPSVVIEATGHPEAIPTAFDLVAWAGRVVLLGSTRGDTEAVNFYRDVHKKGLTVIGAHESARPHVDRSPGWWPVEHDHRVALKLLAQGRLQVQPLITNRFHWQEAPKAYELLVSWDKDVLGMLLNWQSSSPLERHDRSTTPSPTDCTLG